MRDRVGYVAGKVAAVPRDFTNQRRADELLLETREKENGLDLRREVSVGHAHLELRLEVTDRPQPANNRLGTEIAAKGDHEAIEVGRARVGYVRDALLDERHALVDREVTPLGGMLTDGHDYATEQTGRTLHDFDVSSGDRVKGARVDRNVVARCACVAHAGSILRRMSLSSIRNLALYTALAGLCGPAHGCGGDDPAPQKVDPDEPIVKRPRRPDRNADSPFQHADRDPPKERAGEQLGTDELEATLEKAQVEVDNNRKSAAITVLRDCANKIPASARCDGRIGILLGEIPRRKAEARYYLVEGGTADDPKADAAFYVELSETLKRFGEFDAAVTAMEHAIKREDTSEHHAKLSRVLQSMPEHLQRAADELGKAYELDSQDPELLYERATILGQIPEEAAALEGAKVFEAYLAAGKFPDEYREAATKGRITELKSMAKTYAAKAKEEAKAEKDGAKKGSGDGKKSGGDGGPSQKG